MSLPLEKFYVVITFEVRYLVVSKRQPYALMLLSPFRPTAIHSLSIPYTSSYSMSSAQITYLRDLLVLLSTHLVLLANPCIYILASISISPELSRTGTARE